jgi:hypothetical protein
MAVAVTTITMFFAVFVGGPLVRALAGAPAGFGEHFVSRAGYIQAWAVQSASLAAAFLLLGAALGRSFGRIRFGRASLTANPVTVGAGFLVFKIMYAGIPLSQHSVEYFNIRDGVILALLAPFLFTACVVGGAAFSIRRFSDS